MRIIISVKRINENIGVDRKVRFQIVHGKNEQQHRNKQKKEKNEKKKMKSLNLLQISAACQIQTNLFSHF